tara:strand:- start:262 stop:435 length:174 start_codon:yes stop_codon:yes gene_type:complete
MDWILLHAKEIFAAIGAVVSAATFIVGLTPTKKDDLILKRIVAVLNYFSVVNPKKPS